MKKRYWCFVRICQPEPPWNVNVFMLTTWLTDSANNLLCISQNPSSFQARNILGINIGWLKRDLAFWSLYVTNLVTRPCFLWWYRCYENRKLIFWVVFFLKKQLFSLLFVCHLKKKSVPSRRQGLRQRRQTNLLRGPDLATGVNVILLGRATYVIKYNARYWK